MSQMNPVAALGSGGRVVAIARTLDLPSNWHAKEGCPEFGHLFSGMRRTGLRSLRLWLAREYPEWGDLRRMSDEQLLQRLAEAVQLGRVSARLAAPILAIFEGSADAGGAGAIPAATSSPGVANSAPGAAARPALPPAQAGANSGGGTFTAADYEAAALKLGVPVAVVRAVTDVESSGKIFWADGRPPILFEAHWFGKLTKYKYNDSHPHISSRVWNRKLYKGGSAEYGRLEEAKELNESAALQSASWGAFQTMGFHWKALGYGSVQDFVAAMQTAAGQLDTFVRFIVANPKIRDALQRQDWKTFAWHYNGAGQVDAYAARMSAAYARHANATNSHAAPSP